jgi:metal transporter CNNM
MPLYDILNEFQKGGSHMAAVVKVKSNKRKFTKRASFGAHKEERKGFKEYHIAEVDTENKSPHAKLNGESSYKPIEEKPNSETGRHDDGAEGLDEVDVVGIITMEDIMEELLQVSLQHIGIWGV